jgi:hypothetical protein
MLKRGHWRRLAGVDRERHERAGSGDREGIKPAGTRGRKAKKIKSAAENDMAR